MVRKRVRDRYPLSDRRVTSASRSFDRWMVTPCNRGNRPARDCDLDDVVVRWQEQPRFGPPPDVTPQPFPAARQAARTERSHDSGAPAKANTPVLGARDATRRRTALDRQPSRLDPACCGLGPRRPSAASPPSPRSASTPLPPDSPLGTDNPPSSAEIRAQIRRIAWGKEGRGAGGGPDERGGYPSFVWRVELNLRGVYVAAVTPFGRDGERGAGGPRRAPARVSRRRRGRHRGAGDHGRGGGAGEGGEAGRHRSLRAGLCRAVGAADRRGGDQQHGRFGGRGPGAGGDAGAGGGAVGRAVLRAAVGGRDHRALQGGGRRQPRPARRLQHPLPHRAGARFGVAPHAGRRAQHRRCQAGRRQHRPRHARGAGRRTRATAASPSSAATTPTCSPPSSWAAPAPSPPRPTSPPSGSWP